MGNIELTETLVGGRRLGKQRLGLTVELSGSPTSRAQ